MSAILEVKELYKKYSNELVLNDINLRIYPGEILGIIGENGAGKSTLIQCMLGLVKPSKGDILIKDISIKDDEIAAKKSLSYIPELPLLYSDLTVWEHLRLVAMAFEMDENDFKKKGKALLQQFELYEKRNMIPSNFSKGMKQKVAISCALLHDADILLVDEPFTGLDVSSVRDLKEMIMDLNEKGKSIIIATHILDAAEKMCQRFLILKQGETLAQGTIENIKSEVQINKDISLEELFLILVEGGELPNE